MIWIPRLIRECLDLRSREEEARSRGQRGDTDSGCGNSPLDDARATRRGFPVIAITSLTAPAPPLLPATPFPVPNRYAQRLPTRESAGFGDDRELPRVFGMVLGGASV